MNIELKNIKIRDLVKDYNDQSLSDEGITAWSGKLDVRPKYQREFIYNENQEREVINTIFKNFPLSTMYWVKQNNLDRYEILDGQQRTISICRFHFNKYYILDRNGNKQYFHNLTPEEKEIFLNYELMIYFCEGTTSEKLDWFKVVNISGEKLTDQELRNAVYSGPWLSNAKSIFSKSACRVHSEDYSKYLSGSAIRQDYLETVLKWISNDSITDYMAKHQNDKDADPLWQYFHQVISWVQRLFPNYEKIMKGIPWGYFYNIHKDTDYNSNDLTTKLNDLKQNEDVTSLRGIYSYLVTNNSKYLNLRLFNDRQKNIAFEAQAGKCVKCKQVFTIENLQADHIVPWSQGGKTIQSNCQLLCQRCNATKSNN